MRYALLLFTLWNATACAHLIYLDQAQNSFNKGATLENRERENLGKAGDSWAFDPMAGQEALVNSPEMYYSVAYGQVRKALQREPKLKKNGVFSTALTIRALCEWKLGDYKNAEESAKESLKAMKSNGQIRLPRDEAIMTALPGLIKTDQAFDSFMEIKSGAADEQALTNAQATADAAKAYYLKFKEKFVLHWSPEHQKACFEYYDTAYKTPGVNPQTRLYLLIAQLGTANTWLFSHEKMNKIFERTLIKNNKPRWPQDAEWIKGERQWLEENLCQHQKESTLLIQTLEDLMRTLDDKNLAGVAGKWKEFLVIDGLSCQ